MPSFTRLITFVLAVSIFVILAITHANRERDVYWKGSAARSNVSTNRRPTLPHDPLRFDWEHRKEQFPVTEYKPLPEPAPEGLPTVQYDFSLHSENVTDQATRRQRRAQIKAAMKRVWDAYRLKAWLCDELRPISGGNKTTFGGWAATLVDR